MTKLMKINNTMPKPQNQGKNKFPKRIFILLIIVSIFSISQLIFNMFKYPDDLFYHFYSQILLGVIIWFFLLFVKKI